MPLLVGLGLSAGIAFLTFFFGKIHLSQEQTVLVQHPLPAMDVLEAAGIKKFPLSYLEDLQFCSLLTNFKLVPGLSLSVTCHLLVPVLYLLLWSFSLFVFKKYWFPLQSQNNTSQYLCSAARSCNG